MLKDLLKTIGDVIIDLFKQGEIWFVLFLAGFAGIFFFLPITFQAAFWGFIKLTWWLWLFIFMWRLFLSTWLFWRQDIFQKGLGWQVWEIKIPRSNEKGAEAMEAILLSLHGLTNAAGDPKERYWDGEITRTIALEMASFGGEVHFYLRGYGKVANLIEANFHAHYPDLELVQIEDYVHRLPQTLEEIYAQGKDIYGGDLILEKDPVIPLKTYLYFMNDPAEEKRVDPMGAFIELLSKLEPGELVAIQIVLEGARATWTEAAQKYIDEYKEKTSGRHSITTAAGTQTTINVRTPGETELLKDMEENIGKPVFNTMIRAVYISKQEDFYDAYPRRAIKAAFNQYSGVNRNSFDWIEPQLTRAKIWYFPYVFPRLRVEFRKQRLLANYFERNLPWETFMGKLLTSHILNLNFHMKTSILNIEAIASLFHPPTDIVLTTPHIPRQESRRAGPQAGIPIFGDDADIEKYQ
ncbi:MAG: hypothetical protein Q8R20_02135 [Nanoarchaeota archaeon]|nr:hypothetical protein [Nanoarchaeota archaeon]